MPTHDDQINYNVKVRLDPNDTAITTDRSVIYDYSAKKFTLSTAASTDIVVNEGTTRITTSDGTNTKVVANSYFRFIEDSGGTGGTGEGKVQIGTNAALPVQLVDVGQNSDVNNQIIISSTSGDQSFLRLGMDSTDILVAAFGSKTSTNQKFQIGTYPSSGNLNFTPYLSMNHAGRIGLGIDYDGAFIDDANSALEIAGNYLNSNDAPTSTAVLKLTSTSSTTNNLNIAQIVRLNIPQSGFGVAAPQIAPRFIDFQVRANFQGGTLAAPYSAGYVLYTPSGGASMYSVSDKRLKKNFKPFSVGLPELLLINPIEYEWKKSSIAEKGFIAQELYEIYPDAVNKPLTDDVEKEAWTISHSKLTPLLVKSIQDQQEIIKNLKKRIEILEKKIN